MPEYCPELSLVIQSLGCVDLRRRPSWRVVHDARLHRAWRRDCLAQGPDAAHHALRELSDYLSSNRAFWKQGLTRPSCVGRPHGHHLPQQVGIVRDQLIWPNTRQRPCHPLVVGDDSKGSRAKTLPYLSVTSLKMVGEDPPSTTFNIHRLEKLAQNGPLMCDSRYHRYATCRETVEARRPSRAAAAVSFGSFRSEVRDASAEATDPICIAMSPVLCLVQLVRGCGTR